MLLVAPKRRYLVKPSGNRRTYDADGRATDSNGERKYQWSLKASGLSGVSTEQDEMSSIPWGFEMQEMSADKCRVCDTNFSRGKTERSQKVSITSNVLFLTLLIGYTLVNAQDLIKQCTE